MTAYIKLFIMIVVGIVLVGIALVSIPIIITMIIAIISLFIAIIFVWWAFGGVITIKERGVKVGYVRWFKYYTVV